MSTQPLVASDVLADLESYFADRDLGAGMDLETAAQCAALVMEIAAHVRMLKTAKPKGNAGTACTYLEHCAIDLLALLTDRDGVLDRAAELVAAMPAGGRKQALLAYTGGA